MTQNAIMDYPACFTTSRIVLKNTTNTIIDTKLKLLLFMTKLNKIEQFIKF